MRPFAAAAGILALLLPAAPVRAEGQAAGAEPVVTGLDFPAAFTFAPDGRIFYGERFTGEIRIFDPATGSDTLFFTIPDVSTLGEQGLLGLALHPDYAGDEPFVYAYATRDPPSAGVSNQVIRIHDAGGTGDSPTVVFVSNTRPAGNHNGGRILFGPDGQLFAVIGDATDPANAQDPSSTAGKVVRMAPDGTVPPDNPFPGSYVYSYGHRNSYGFTFDPVTGLLWETENGPKCNDEINLVLAGRNYAWGPHRTCLRPPPPPLNTNQDGPDRVLPEAFVIDTVAPTGGVFCDACGLTGGEGDLFVSANNNGFVYQLVLTPDRQGISSASVAYDHPRAVYSMERAPDGTLHFSDQAGIFRLVDQARR